MRVLSTSFKEPVKYSLLQQINKKNVENNFVQSQRKTTELPIGFNTSYNITFGNWTNPNRLVGDVDLASYHIMTDRSKERYRDLYYSFYKNDEIDQKKLFDVKTKILPLRSEDTMEDFLNVSKLYLKYKDQPIVCLGRSPKWFLDTASWLKDGIDDYKFVAFSGYWYRPVGHGEVKLIKSEEPTKEEETAYRRYLDRVGVIPQKIVETMKNEGKKTVITDYLCTGKGACSFLDMLARYADDEGILEDFSKSIQIVGIGSMDYLEDLFPLSDTISAPRVPMPPLLEPYSDNIKQEFYNMDYPLFEEILLNRNTNECRSTYYPHNAWTEYAPDEFKTGMIKDMSIVRMLKEKFKNEKYITAYTAPMQDYRNLLNFRILDYLNSKGILREDDTFTSY